MVQQGETLYRISRAYNVTVDQLCQWNHIRAEDPLSICQELKVRPAAQAGSSVSTVPAATAQGKREHIVRPGETLEGIARAYGYRVERFSSFNGLRPGEVLQPGRVLLTSDCVCPPLQDAAAATLPAVASYSDQPGVVPSPYDAASKALPSATTEPPPNPQQPPVSPTGAQPASAQEGISKPRAFAPFMQAEEVAMVDEINLVRFNPPAYVPYVTAYLEDVRKGRAYGSVEACQELINELKSMAPLPVLEPSECLYEAAHKHVNSQRQTGAILHLGEDGSYPWERIRRACAGMSDGNENIVSGAGQVRQAVMLLLVDEGIPNRGHRRILLDKGWKFVACYKAGQVGATTNNWVQEFGK